MTKHLLMATTAAAALFAGAAGADTDSTSMNVSANVTAACTDITATDLAFGDVQQADMDYDATATITVTCGNGVPYTVELDYGFTPNGTTRQMTGADFGQTLAYDIYQPDATGAGSKTSGFWGPLGDGLAYGNTSSGTPQDLTATGTVHVTAGTSSEAFSDIVTVTLNF